MTLATALAIITLLCWLSLAFANENAPQLAWAILWCPLLILAFIVAYLATWIGTLGKKSFRPVVEDADRW